MICPHCAYEDAVAGNYEGLLQGPLGDFFKSTTMTRESPVHKGYKEVIPLYGCPSCLGTFMSKADY